MYCICDPVFCKIWLLRRAAGQSEIFCRTRVKTKICRFRQTVRQFSRRLAWNQKPCYSMSLQGWYWGQDCPRPHGGGWGLVQQTTYFPQEFDRDGTLDWILEEIMRTFLRHVRGFLSLMHQSCVTPAPSGEKHWKADMCIIPTSSWTSSDSGKALPTCLLHYDHFTTADCSGVWRFSIVGLGVPNLGTDWLKFIGGAMTVWGGGTKHFKIMRGGGSLAPAAPSPVPTLMDCIQF